MSFLKKVMFSYALAVVFIAVYETARVSLDLGEFRFVGLMFLDQPVGSFIILSFVAGLVWSNSPILQIRCAANLHPKRVISGTFLLFIVYVSTLGAMYFLLSPFVGWALTVFVGPHQNLFEFYLVAWRQFDAFDLTALLVASGVLWVMNFFAHFAVLLSESPLGVELD